MSAELQGNGSPQESQGQAPPEGGQPEAPKGLTNEDFNRAFTARFRDVEKRIEGKIADALTQATGKLEGSLTEKLSALLSGVRAEPSGSGGGGEGDAHPPAPGGAQPPAQPPRDPEVTALKRQLTEMKNKLSAQDAEREAERTAARDLRMRTALSDRLAAHGIDAKRVKHAVGFLVDAEKLVSVDASGSLVFKASDGEMIDLESGLREWVASDDGKLYLPPRGVAGSGSESQQSRQTSRANAPSDPRSAALKLIRDSFNS